MENSLLQGWKKLRIGDIALITDYVANGSFASLKENVAYLKEPDYAILVRLKDYNNSWEGPFVYVDKKAYEFLAKSSLRPGDLFIANVGAPGKLFIVPDLGKPMTIAPNGILVRCDESITSNSFLAAFFSSHQGKSAIEKIVSGSAQQKFNKTEFRKIEVPIPPIEEQNRIMSRVEKFFKIKQQMDNRYYKAKNLIDKLTTSVLAKAFGGELITQNSKDGPTS